MLAGVVGAGLASRPMRESTPAVAGILLTGIIGGGLGAEIIRTAMGLAEIAPPGGAEIGTWLSQLLGAGCGGAAFGVVVTKLARMLSRG